MMKQITESEFWNILESLPGKWKTIGSHSIRHVDLYACPLCAVYNTMVDDPIKSLTIQGHLAGKRMGLSLEFSSTIISSADKLSHNSFSKQVRQRMLKLLNR